MRRAAHAGLAVLLLAAPALAAGGGEGEGGVGLLWPTVNFVMLLAVLVWLARKPAQAYFASRRDAIHTQLQTAAELKKDAEERYAKWQRRLVDLERELEGIRATARERAETEREHILADARASAERIKRDASTAIDQELRRAKDQLRQEASDLAVELAAGLLRENVNDSDRERLLDEFIARVEAVPDAGTSPASHGSGS
jgi:F-type H+-transporting ATPase subunit b